jgi:molecular chaperone Hsp33
MIMPKSSDLLQTGLCTAHRIRWCHVDVTDSARALSQAHLCGPTAALVLAEALGGVAVLSHELTLPDETVSFWMRVRGPVQGVLVEAAQDGALRGYTQVKLLNDLDGREEFLSAPALGEAGEVRVVRSVPGRVISRAGIDVAPPSVQNAINRYLHLSLQRDAFVAVQAFAYEGGVDLSRAFLAECLPQGDRAEYERLRSRAEEGSLHEALELADGARGFCAEMAMTQVEYDAPRRLRFACRCSSERALATLGAMPAAELREMAASGKPAEIFCHMCGRNYAYGAEVLLKLTQAGKNGARGDASHA